MQIQIDLALIIALISLVSTGVSIVFFLSKIRFEVDQLKNENKQQFEKLEKIDTALSTMKEMGSMPTKELSHRMDEIDSQVQSLSKTITDVLIKVESLTQVIGFRREVRSE